MNTAVYLLRPLARIAEPSGIPTREFYQFLLQLQTATGVDYSAQIAELRSMIEGITPSDPETLRAIQSLVIRDGLISLLGDQDEPGGQYYYGTNAEGERGFFPVVDAIEVTDDLTREVTTGGYNVLGELDSYGDLPATGELNDAYLIDNDLWLWEGQDWTNIGPPTTSVVLGLADVPDTGAGTLQAITVDAKGRVVGTRDATITGTAQQIDVADGDAAAGLPTLSLADEVLDSLARADSAVQQVVAGDGVNVDSSDPRRPIVSTTGGPPALLRLPFYLSDGSYAPIALTSAYALPFYLTSGVRADIPTVTA